MSEATKLAEYLGFEVVYLDGFAYIQEEGEQGPEINREANLEERTLWTDLVRLSAELAALKAAMGEPKAIMWRSRDKGPWRFCDAAGNWPLDPADFTETEIVPLYAIPKDKP